MTVPPRQPAKHRICSTILPAAVQTYDQSALELERKAHLLLLDAGIFEGQLNAGGDTQAVCTWVCHVVGIAGDGPSQVFCRTLQKLGTQRQLTIADICRSFKRAAP